METTGYPIYRVSIYDEPDFVSLSCCVYDKLVVEVEEEGAHVLVVHLAASVGLFLKLQKKLCVTTVEIQKCRIVEWLEFGMATIPFQSLYGAVMTLLRIVLPECMYVCYPFDL